MAEDDLQELSRVLRFLQGSGEQRFEIPLDGRQRRAQLVGDVGDELRAHLLEPPQLGDVVQDHHHTHLIAAQGQPHRVHLEPPLEGCREA